MLGPSICVSTSPFAFAQAVRLFWGGHRSTAASIALVLSGFAAGAMLVLVVGGLIRAVG
jgi:hypothetical protein